MLLHHARVRKSIEMTMHHFWHGLKYNIKGIVRHHHYTTMNEILHHAREAESQLAKEAQVEAWYSSTRQFFARTPYSPSDEPIEGAASHPSSSLVRPASTNFQVKKPAAPTASTGSNMSTTHIRDRLLKEICPRGK
jgi:hypothetical protein